MRLTPIILAALIPLALTGCADFKGMPSLDMKLPELFGQQPKTAADTPTKLQKDWWKSTNDVTLLATIHALERLNLSLKQAQLRLNAARIDRHDYDYLPNLTASTDAQFDRLIDGEVAVGGVNPQAGGKKTTGYYSAKLDASWEVPIYGQLTDAANIAEATIAFAEADIDAVRSSVISEAVRLYAEMRAKQQEVLRRQAVVAAAARISEYQTIKLKAGLITETEHGVSRQSLLAAKNALTRTQSDTVARMQQLANLLGAVTPDDAWKTPAPIPSFELPDFVDTPADVLRNRPDIRKAEASVLTAAGELNLSKSNMYPKLTLSGNLSQLGNITGNPLPGNTVQLTGIPSISLPLFDWGKRLAAAQVKDEQLAEKASIYRETVIAAMNEVEEFWSAYHTAQLAERTATEQVRITANDDAHARILFKQGITDGIARQQAIIDAENAAIAELQAKAATITQLAALTKALGGASTSFTSEAHHD